MTPFHDPAELPRFTELEAEYEVLQELGRGGTAVVYLARERELDRLVALKVIRSAYIEDPEAAARLVREARTIGGLQHPNIVVLYGTRHLRDGSLALVMQYVPGRTLKAEIEAVGPLPFARVEQVLADVGRALSYAHRHRIVHRDIKPENIYLDEDAGTARLSDFGIARPWEAESSLTLPGSALGTPAYMSPEQIDGGPLDGRSDLYSLGMIGYEMLTGTRPWAGENLFSIIYKQKHEELPPLGRFRRGIPPALRLAVEGAMRKAAEERWADADEFLAVLAGAEPSDAASRRRPRRRGPGTPGPGVAPAGAAAGDAVDDGRTIQYRRPAPERHAGGPASEAPRVARAAPAGGSRATPAAIAPQSAPVGPPDPSVAGRIAAVAAAAGAGVRNGATSGSAPPPPDTATSDQPSYSELNPAPPRRVRQQLIAAGLVLALVATAVSAAMRPWADSEPPPAAAAPPAVMDAPAETPAPPAAGPAAVVYALLGAHQEGAVGDTLAQPLVARVEDASGNAVEAAVVRFRVVAGEGVVVPAETATDWAGTATGRWVLHGPGPHRVEAVVEALNGPAATFTAAVAAAVPARLLPVSGTELSGTAGRPLPAPVIVRVEDAAGMPLADVPVRFSVQSGGGSLEPGAARTDAEGQARATWTLGSAGPQVAVARVPDVQNAAVVFRAGPGGPPPLPVRSGLVAGGTHTCAVDGDGTFSCWGGNDRGQIGDGGTGRRDSPFRVSTPEPIATAAAGVAHTCAISTAGTAYCWGSNAQGQLGDGTQVTRTRPTRVAGEERLTSIGVGTSHSCAVSAGGGLYCWGQNSHGQLGDGSTVSRATPVRAGGSRQFRSVAVGWSHTCGLGSDGVAWCWGRNAGGQLGDGGTADRAEPVRVAGAHRFTALAAGSAHTCGVRSDGALLCWGLNSNGQLGTGGASSATPVAVAGDETFTSVTAGAVHTCALTRDGAAHCWGRNTYGQLGDGTTEDRPRPTPVAGGLRFSTLVANGAHTCGSGAGGGWHCWGYNLEGQLGDGTRTNQLRPTAARR